MAFVYDDLVQETSTSTGTGDMVLAGAAVVTGQVRREFSAVMSNGDTTDVSIMHANGTEFENVRVTFNSGPDSLTRSGTIYSSSNGGAAVTFSAGTKTITMGLPSDLAQPLGNGKLLRVDAAQSFSSAEKNQAQANIGVASKATALAIIFG